MATRPTWWLVTSVYPNSEYNYFNWFESREDAERFCCKELLPLENVKFTIDKLKNGQVISSIPNARTYLTEHQHKEVAYAAGFHDEQIRKNLDGTIDLVKEKLKQGGGDEARWKHALTLLEIAKQWLEEDTCH